MSGSLLATEDPWVGYARTIVEIAGPSGPLTVRADQTGAVGRWPWDGPDAVFVLTAWDPGEERPGLDVNRRRQAALEEDVSRLTDARWHARGLDPETGHREEGIAVRGLAAGQALGLGARYRQDAVFCWTPDAWEILACAGVRRVRLGWVATLAGP